MKHETTINLDKSDRITDPGFCTHWKGIGSIWIKMGGAELTLVGTADQLGQTLIGLRDAYDRLVTDLAYNASGAAAMDDVPRDLAADRENLDAFDMAESGKSGI